MIGAPSVMHDVYSPIQLDDGQWYAECSCGWDAVSDDEDEAEEMTDEHSMLADAELDAAQNVSYTTSVNYIGTATSTTNFMLYATTNAT